MPSVEVDRRTEQKPEWQTDFAASYPDLAKLTDSVWLSIIQSAKYMEVPPGVVLLEQGEVCNGFLLLLTGGVRVFQYAPDGREITLYRLEPGDICIKSMNSLLHKRPFTATAETETETETTALVLSPNDFFSALRESEQFSLHIMTKMTDRFCDVLTIVEDSVFKRLDMRLACLLGHLFEKEKTDTLKITHQELAMELGTTREVVSRVLKEMERQDCVKLSRGRIRIASTEGLKWFQHHKKQ